MLVQQGLVMHHAHYCPRRPPQKEGFACSQDEKYGEGLHTPLTGMERAMSTAPPGLRSFFAGMACSNQNNDVKTTDFHWTSTTHVQ